MPPDLRSRLPLRTVRRFAMLAILLPVLACDAGFPSSEGRAAIDRETFIRTYVDLRLAALEGETGRISEAERDRVLAEHGVTEDALRSFIEVHGRNVPYMNELWIEVDQRIRTELESADQTPPEPADPG
jgi:hypothetical protein